jgi:hypothetical protein
MGRRMWEAQGERGRSGWQCSSVAVPHGCFIRVRRCGLSGYQQWLVGWLVDWWAGALVGGQERWWSGGRRSGCDVHVAISRELHGLRGRGRAVVRRVHLASSAWPDRVSININFSVATLLLCFCRVSAAALLPRRPTPPTPSPPSRSRSASPSPHHRTTAPPHHHPPQCASRRRSSWPCLPSPLPRSRSLCSTGSRVSSTRPPLPSRRRSPPPPRLLLRPPPQRPPRPSSTR